VTQEPRTPLADLTEQDLAALYDRLDDAEDELAERREAGHALYQSWNEQRAALAEGATLAAHLHNALLILRYKMAASSRDWSQDSDDAWLYAVLYGWDCEQQHEHTSNCRILLEQVAATHRWDTERVARIRKQRAVFAQVGPNGETAARAARQVEEDTP
jgi:hypothetical protein